MSNKKICFIKKAEENSWIMSLKNWEILILNSTCQPCPWWPVLQVLFSESRLLQRDSWVRWYCGSDCHSRAPYSAAVLRKAPGQQQYSAPSEEAAELRDIKKLREAQANNYSDCCPSNPRSWFQWRQLRVSERHVRNFYRQSHTLAGKGLLKGNCSQELPVALTLNV